MKTNRIRLVVCTILHLEEFYKFRNDEKYLNFVNANPNPVDYNQFKEEYNLSLVNRPYQYMVYYNENVIGYTYLHTISKHHGYCYLNIFIKKEFETKGFGLEILYLMHSYVFSELKMHKMYLEIFNNNQLSLRSALSAGFVQEGFFKGHLVRNGERISVYRFACYKELPKRVTEIMKRFL